MQNVYDVVIVGGGAAGLSAALVLGRARRNALIVDEGKPRNAVADRMHGFLTREGTPPAQLLDIARDELKQYPSLEFVRDRAIAVRSNGEVFSVRTAQSEFAARRILLATGVYDELPAIDGIGDLWGKAVFVCPYCDGWELRDKRLAVAGKGHRAVALAQEVRQWTGDLVVCLQGRRDLPPADERWLSATGAHVREEPIRALSRNGRVDITFSEGPGDTCDALFICAPLRPRSPIADMLGCAIGEDGKIVAGDRGRTSVANVYAAGDATAHVHQVILAAASGVCAAMAINEDMLEEEVRQAVRAID